MLPALLSHTHTYSVHPSSHEYTLVIWVECDGLVGMGCDEAFKSWEVVQHMVGIKRPPIVSGSMTAIEFLTAAGVTAL